MKEKQNIGEIDWTLVGKYLAGEANSAEIKKVEEWSKQSDKNLAELHKSRQMLENIDNYYRFKKFDSEIAWKKVNSKTNELQTNTFQLKSSRKEVFRHLYKYAAVLLVAIALGYLGYYFGIKNQSVLSNTEISAAEKQVVNEYILPDGSMVALNSNSKLIFPKEFKTDIREVTIIGEAFFDVKPNPKKPFVIHAGNAEVKVLGTSFNVRAYPENEAVEVVVESGMVQVSKAVSNEGETIDDSEIILNRGEKGMVFKSNKKLEKSVNRDLNYLAWKTQNLVFNETPLNEVTDYLERVYHIDIQLQEEELNELTLSATFNKKPVDFVLNVIQLTFDLELTNENDLFILSIHKNEDVKL
jgi:ferric-dicitrate binding protein FerR (iron transport regulator)